MSKTAAPKKGECKVVLVPADPHEPVQEFEISYGEEDEVSCLQNYAQAHFQKIKPKKTPEQIEAQRDSLLRLIPEDQRKSVSDAVLDQAMGMNMVEHVALLSNATYNNFTGVTMYCDDEAVAVGLPINIRASEIAACAGRPMEVRGDVFLARVFDNEESFQRLDFTASEVSSTAAWVKEAQAQNERKRKEESSGAILERMQQASKAKASTSVKELTEAEAEKEAGNQAFKEGKFAKALELYSRAIELDHQLTVAYSNRALAKLKVGDSLGAESDCDHVLLRDAANVKALLRRASAREQLGRKGEALQDYREVSLLEPSNKVAASKIKELQPQESEEILATAS